MKSHDSVTAVHQIVLKLSSMTANSFWLYFSERSCNCIIFLCWENRLQYCKVANQEILLNCKQIWYVDRKYRFPFHHHRNFAKWILSTSQGKQKTGVCVCACVCVCVRACFFFIKIFSVLIICTRCILRLIRYILLVFLCI